MTTFSDVTERKIANDALAASERRLQTILDAVPASVFVKDRRGRSTFVNHTFEVEAGRPSSEIIGRTAGELAPEVSRGAEEQDEELFRTGVVEPRMLRNGDSVYLTTKVVLPTPEGAPYALAGISTDITAQVRAVETQAIAATVVESTTDAIVTFDLDHVVTGTNAAARRAEPEGSLGSVGRPLFAGLPSYPDLDDLQGRLDAVTAGLQQEWEVRYAVGVLAGRTVSVRGFPIRSVDDEIIGGAVMARDVTSSRAAVVRERDLQRQVDHLQRLESLGQLAGGVAHDFNNLLAAINLTAEMLTRSLPPEGQQRRYAEQILAITSRGVALTRQMLVFARREPRTYSVVELNEVVRRADQLLERTLGEHVGRTLALDEIDLPVEADAAQLEQVVINLAVNARDAMPTGGAITLTTGRVTLAERDLQRFGGVAAAGDYAVLTVSDDGPGMDADLRARAMEPFFTTQPAGQGTGLGLSLVYGVASQVGGGVVIYSEPSAGTTVRVYLPLSGAAPSHVDEMAEEPAVGRGELILLVEDSTDLRELLQELLSGFGYRVVACASAELALEAMASGEVGEPALLLTDVVMPGLTGPQLAARLREDRSALPVLLMSGYSGDHPLHDAQHAADLLLEKPFTAEDVLHAVRRVLDGD